MVNTPSKSRHLLLAVVAVCVLATLWVLFQSERDSRVVIGEESLERLSSEIVALRKAVGSLEQSIAGVQLGAPPLSQRELAPLPSASDDKLDLLHDAVERLEVSLESLFSQATQLVDEERSVLKLRSEYDNARGQEPTQLSNVFDSAESALKELLFLGYEDVLRRLGPPTQIYPNDGAVNWTYGHSGTVQFVDGMVISLRISK